MISAGVDVGGKVIKAVLLRDGQILSKVAIPASHDRRQAAAEAVEEAAKQAGISWEQIERMTSTGVGSRRATFAAEKLSRELQKRIRILEDIEAIRNLKARYCRCNDKKQWDGLADCFAKDAMPVGIGHRLRQRYPLRKES